LGQHPAAGDRLILRAELAESAPFGQPHWTYGALFGIKLKAAGGPADLLAMTKQVSIGFKRRLALAFAIVFAALAVSSAWQAVSSHDLARLVIVLVVFGGTAAAYVIQVLRREPVLVLDEEGLTDRRGGTAVRWCEIEDAHVAERHGPFDHDHDLVLTLVRGQTLSLSLDQLTSSWSEVVTLIEGRLGRQVSVLREGGLVRHSRLRVLPG